MEITIKEYELPKLEIKDYDKLLEAVKNTCKDLKGSYAIEILSIFI